jgi:hypothetical protein
VDYAALIRFLGTIFEARETDIVCSEFFELLPRYVDLVANAGEPGAAQSAFRRWPSISPSAWSAPRSTRPSSTSPEPVGKI